MGGAKGFDLGRLADQLTCCHDACGGNWQHVLVAVRRVVGWPTRLPTPICLCPRGGDGEKCCLVVRRRGVRKGGVLLLLLFHLVQEHGVFDLRVERERDSRKLLRQGFENKLCSYAQSHLSWNGGECRPKI